MPNWCMNELTISGPRKAVAEFLNDAGYNEGCFSFGRLRPIPQDLLDIHYGSVFVGEVQYTWWREKDGVVSPLSNEEIDELTKKYGTCDAYHWCISNWGTKWDCCNLDYLSDSFRDGDDYPYVELMFETAWGPPDILYDYLTQEYPEVCLDWFYKEPGCRMAGWLGDE